MGERGIKFRVRQAAGETNAAGESRALAQLLKRCEFRAVSNYQQIKRATSFMRNVNELRKLEHSGKPFCRSDICCNSPAQEAPHECEQPKSDRSQPSLFPIATQTNRMPVLHEMPRTRGARRFDEQLPVWADRLEPMMLDHCSLTGDFAK